MFNQWIRTIKSATQADNAVVSEDELRDNIARVSAALLIEVARADHQLEDDEINSVVRALEQSSKLDSHEIKEIVAAAVVDADSAVSLHDHILVINEQFEQEQKYLLIEQMWRVAAADGNIDQYEDYTIRKLSELLYVRHSEFIKAKLRVID